MAYIEDADITDVLALQFSADFSTYHSLADNQLIDLGLQLGVDDTDDFATTGGFIDSWFIKQYLVTYFCTRLFLDKMGLNNVSLADEEKYAVKYNFYKGEMEKRESRITVQMLIGSVNEIADRAEFNGFLYRT